MDSILKKDEGVKFRIGIASSDGKVVNQHFGRATRFHIVDIDNNDEMLFVETREMPAVCQGGNHDDNRLEENVKLLSDCNYILVSRIGQGAANILNKYNISAFEIPALVEDAVRKLVAYIEIQSMLV